MKQVSYYYIARFALHLNRAAWRLYWWSDRILHSAIQNWLDEA